MTTKSPPGAHGTRRRPVRAWVRSHPADVIDVFVYTVVLNLAVEYLPSVISEGFTLSLLTAVLLKAALELVLLAKAAAMRRLRGARTVPGRAVAALGLWGVAAGSKLVVLWAVDVAFGGAVSLGGFVPVTLLVLTLLFARGLVRRLLGVAASGEHGAEAVGRDPGHQAERS